MPTDHHVAIRDAAKTVLAAVYTTIDVHALEDLESVLNKSMPFIGVACVGPDENRAELHTNAQDGLGYKVMAALFAAGLADGAKSGSPVPDMTSFRRQVRVSFHNKRLSGVSQVAWCEVSDSGPVYDENSPQFQKLSTALVITAIGRFSRS